MHSTSVLDLLPRRRCTLLGHMRLAAMEEGGSGVAIHGLMFDCVRHQANVNNIATDACRQVLWTHCVPLPVKQTISKLIHFKVPRH